MAATADRADHELVALARDGSQEAFEALILRHGDRLHATLRGFGLTATEADDVAQETLLRAWRGLAGFERRSGFFTWIYRIAFNETQRRLAQRPSAGELSDEVLDVVADSRPATHTAVEHRELAQALEDALSRLAPELRAPVLLRDVEGRSTDEAAKILDLKPAALKSRLHRGRMVLREQLASYLT
jgi:RNA polymerase sigma-70 factor (ECF subfamily)